MCSIRISDRTPAILTDVFRDFPQFRLGNSGIIPNEVTPIPYKSFQIHLSSYHSMLYSLRYWKHRKITHFQLQVRFAICNCFKISIKYYVKYFICVLLIIYQFHWFCFTVCKTDQICWRWKLSNDQLMDRANWNCRVLKTVLTTYKFLFK
jgi:hypothetical protein